MKNIIKSIIAALTIIVSSMADSVSVPMPTNSCWSINYWLSNPTEERLSFFYSKTAPQASILIWSSSFWDVKTIVTTRIDGVVKTETKKFTRNPFLFLNNDGVVVSLDIRDACKQPNNYAYGQIFLYYPGKTNVVESGWVYLKGR